MTVWPVTPPTWLQGWVIWRFLGKPPPRPADIPTFIPTWAWCVLKWCAWRRAGKTGERPDCAPRTIPSWAFSLLKILNQAVPIEPPPPPPPQPVSPSSWTLPNPITWTAWGWLFNADFRDSDVALQRMFIAGVRTVALQVGQFPPDVPDRCRAFGFKVALWGIPDPADETALTAAQADGYIPQVEGPYQYAAARDNLAAGVGAGLSLSVVTTLAGIETYVTLPDGGTSTAEAETLKSLGCTHAWVECYQQEGYDLPIQMWTARSRGLAHSNPLLGVYHDYPLTNYRPAVDPYGRQVGVYLAEAMRPEDWTALEVLGT